jgi:molybdopterin converting factor small subunit
VVALRLFGPAREAAGTAREELDGATVDEVLAAARARFGPVFAEVLARSAVWVNGDEAPGGRSVGPSDEVAVLPPISGG